MKAVISSTYDPKYLFFLPIVTWCWNKLGVDVICFIPLRSLPWNDGAKFNLVQSTLSNLNIQFKVFDCSEYKEATYAQCSRLYAGALDLPEDEILITSDVDMAVFKIPNHDNKLFHVFGHDLVPEEQYPICYISANAKAWKNVLVKERTYQECLDDLLGEIECVNMRGNYWGKDQEEAYNKIAPNAILHSRAKPGTQFATNRVDRDDINWRSYVNDELIDAHLWRPGYDENNFKNILELLTSKYPNEDFRWLVNYHNNFVQLLNPQTT